MDRLLPGLRFGRTYFPSVSLTVVSTVKVRFVLLLFANPAMLVMITSNRLPVGEENAAC